jgi:hypothetical protein
MDPLAFLFGAVAGAIGAALALYRIGVRTMRTETADDAAVADVRIDAEVYGVGYLRKRPDGRLERVSPALFVDREPKPEGRP